MEKPPKNAAKFESSQLQLTPNPTFPNSRELGTHPNHQKQEKSRTPGSERPTRGIDTKSAGRALLFPSSGGRPAGDRHHQSVKSHHRSGFRRRGNPSVRPGMERFLGFRSVASAATKPSDSCAAVEGDRGGKREREREWGSVKWAQNVFYGFKAELKIPIWVMRKGIKGTLLFPS